MGIKRRTRRVLAAMVVGAAITVAGCGTSNRAAPSRFNVGVSTVSGASASSTRTASPGSSTPERNAGYAQPSGFKAIPVPATRYVKAQLSGTDTIYVKFGRGWATTGAGGIFFLPEAPSSSLQLPLNVPFEIPGVGIWMGLAAQSRGLRATFEIDSSSRLTLLKSTGRKPSCPAHASVPALQSDGWTVVGSVRPTTSVPINYGFATLQLTPDVAYTIFAPATTSVLLYDVYLCDFRVRSMASSYHTPSRFLTEYEVPPGQA